MARLDLYRDGGFVQSLKLEAGCYVVGRGDRCDLRLADPLASRRHFEILKQPEGYLMRDLGTVNGTDVNGVREYHCVLTKLSVLQVGEEILLYHPTKDADLGPGASDSLPRWAQDSLSGAAAVRPPAFANQDALREDDEQDADLYDPTAELPPVELKRLHSQQIARTRPHLLLHKKGQTEIFPLDRRVNEIGLGRLQISLGDASGSTPKVLAEIRAEAGHFVVKARGSFSRVRVSGRKLRTKQLQPGDVLELAGVELEFREGLESPEDFQKP